MRGWFVFGPSLAGGLVGNYLCHHCGRPTVSSDTRRLDPVVFCAAWGALTGYLVSHLYLKEPHRG